MTEFTKDEENEIKYLWINKCYSVSEIAEWFGVSWFVIKRRIKQIKISEREFQEKYAGFTEFLNQHPNNKLVQKMIKERKKRLIEAYDRTRHLK